MYSTNKIAEEISDMNLNIKQTHKFRQFSIGLKSFNISKCWSKKIASDETVQFSNWWIDRSARLPSGAKKTNKKASEAEI